MAPHKVKTNQEWSTEFDTIRRQQLFANPPTDRTAYPLLAAAIEPHVHSFNAIFEPNGLLSHALRDIGTRVVLDGNPFAPVEEAPTKRNRLQIRIRDVFLQKPQIPPSNKFNLVRREVLPSECRERHATYRGRLTARLEVRVNEGDWKELDRELGNMPIMLRTNKCHLERMKPAQLVAANEESEELGGYFIVNGNEKLIRMLALAKRNYPMAIERQAFANRGKAYSKYGVQLRSVRPDQTSQTNTLHYLTDGNVNFRFSWRKNEYLVPVMMILNALVETNDREIFEAIVGDVKPEGLDRKQFVMDRVEPMLRTYKGYGVRGVKKTRSYLGSRFRPVLVVPEDMSDYEVGTEFLRKIVLPHLGNVDVTPAQDMDKFRMLLFMIRKLYALAEGECTVDNPDAVSNQEVLLPGFLYIMILKEKLEDLLSAIRLQAIEWCRSTSWSPFTAPQFEKDLVSKILRKTNENIGSLLEYFLATGNLVSGTGLDLQQTSGYTVVAEKINFFRFISHFRMIHRGSFFAQLKTTTVRKLLPESWGFLCPVHTPDGAPCGLLNHLAHQCKVATHSVNVSKIPEIVARFGVTERSSAHLENGVVVQLDGRVLGFCSPKQALTIHDSLRYWKCKGEHDIPKELEIGYIPNSNGGQYPGIYMFSHAARMYRPVKYLALDKLDYVGPFEQPFMNIACVPEEIKSGQHTHVEFDPTNILSILANLTPFSDFNQSPRNMYQCQMGKQSMGTPGTAIARRTDNKSYRLQTGQTPVVRPPLYNAYGLDNFPNGMNAVVAVISYTAYDMDDAMILNKSAHERGFGYGTIYKTHVIDLAESSRSRATTKRVTKLFGFAPGGLARAEWKEKVDDDGLPAVGQLVRAGDVIAVSHAVSHDTLTGGYINRDGRTDLHRYKDEEDAFIDEVRLIGSEDGNSPLQAISIKYRIPRSPVIGDKFSSRHGQKGVCSQKWPAIDLPFSESGMQPDIIINPHAFPSRMTIGMFVESLAGKAGALHGIAQDSTPFRFDESDTAVDYFGEQLMRAGYNYYGNEPMYSGITGGELAADIYIGVVFYQRLRHMVNDKYQVRTTGHNNPVTGQPIKGRKKGGGIRVGEMERDALLAHGTAFLLQDRLLNCSDYTRAWICRDCGGFLATTPVVGGFGKAKAGAVNNVRCRRCATKAEGFESRSEVWEDGNGEKFVGGEDVTVVAIPAVLKYLDVELAAMGIKMSFKVTP